MEQSSVFWMNMAVTSWGLALGGLVLYLVERGKRRKLVAEQASMSSQIQDRSLRDKLTGLLNRAGFAGLLDKAVKKADRQDGGSFCVLYVSVDNFSMLNDAFGHDVGDQLLRDAALRLANCTGVKAEACRVSAGEFALILSGGLPIGRTAAQQITRAFDQGFAFDSFQTQISCSIGIAMYPLHGSRAKLLGNAALAMRTVKAGGGRDFCEYDPKMGLDARDQALMVTDLRHALEGGQFELYFQPKIDAFSLQVTAAEALLRWRHPTRGFVSPVVFIPLAEQHGLIGSIGNWVIQEACRHAAQWRKSGLRMRVAVNISSQQMREDDLIDRITAALRQHGIHPERFTCEITESVAMEDTKVTQLTFEKMRQLGVHVSIDDFGTGYSSLAALRKLPAAELKIDRAFVMDLVESEDARSIAQSIISLATALNLRVVAEGVETVGQCELLVAMGCNELQGYLFSMPVPAAELERMALREHTGHDVEFRSSLFADANGASVMMGLR